LLSDLALLALKALERVGRENERVFPYNAVGVWRHYQKRAKRLGFPSTKFHDLRHTCATLLLGENTHEQVALTMGRLLTTEVA
jgi:integrase